MVIQSIVLTNKTKMSIVKISINGIEEKYPVYIYLFLIKI